MSTQLPEAVARYLGRLRERRDVPLCLRLDQGYYLQDWWGEPSMYGLAMLEPGMDVREEAPFLDHLDPNDVTMVPFVSITSEHAAHVHAIPDANGWFVLLTLASTELRQRRNLQQSANELHLLADQQRRLLDELVETKAELEIRRDQVEEADRSKGRFIASLSHELRTPLSAIVGYTRLIREHASADPELGGNAQAIERCAQHLLALIEQVLEQARLESGEVTIRPVDVNLRELVQELTSILAPLAADKGLAFAAHVDSAVPRYLRLDPVRLRQMLINLLGNGIKFTNEGSVRVAVAWRDGELVVTVTDTGPGIAEADSERIFRPFQRADGDKERGAGLGLAITQHIVQRMRGAIELQSAPDEGSTFTLRFPAERAGEARSLETPDVAPLGPVVPQRGVSNPQDPARVLVAEDDQDMRELLTHFFTQAGFQPAFASQAQTAVDAALSMPPALLVLDLHLNGADGVEVARALREAGFDAPILALSASTSQQDRERALAAGCNEFISKPFAPASLLATIRHLLSG